MNKLELAHDYAKIMFKISAESGDLFLENTDEVVKSIVLSSFNLAEEMLAENEKRKDKSLPEVLEEFEIDWSKIPEWTNFFAIDKDGLQYIYAYQPYLVDERDYWADHLGLQDGHSEEVELIKNYTGNWKYSLRKRP